MEKEYKSDVIDFTPAQIRAGKITAVVVMFLLAVWLFLVGINLVPIAFWDIFLGSLLCAIGLILLIGGAIQKNSVSIWLSFPFLVPATIEFLCKFTIYDYSILYPLYIAIPALASLVCLTFTSGKLAHVKVVIFFALQAVFYLLSVLNLIEIYVSIILSVLCALSTIVYISIRIFRSNNRDE